MISPYLIKQALIEYNRNLLEKDRLNIILDVLEDMDDQPSGSGIIKLPEGNPLSDGMRKAIKITTKDSIRLQIYFMDFNIKIAEDFMNRLDGLDLEIVQSKFVERLSYADLAQKFNYCHSQVFRYIEQMIITHSDEMNFEKMGGIPRK